MNAHDIRSQALDILGKVRLFYFATVDGDTPRVRPMTRLYHDGFVIWTCSHKDTNKMKDIRANPHVEACFLDDSNRQLRVLGKVSVVDSETGKEQLPLNPMELPMLEDPDYLLLKIEPLEVRMVNDWALEYKNIPIE